MNGEIWTHDNCNPIQLTHFRASRPCYVNLVKPFDAQDVEDDKDEFLDYIENCDGKALQIPKKKMSNYLSSDSKNL